MDAVGRSDFTLYIERIIEPYTGMVLLGVSGFAPAAGWSIQIWYDAELAMVLDAHATEPGHPFSTQLPWEKVERIRVVAVGASTVVLFDDLAASVADRSAVHETEPESLTVRVGQFIRRAIQSVTSGEIVSVSRWSARLGRFSGFRRNLVHKIRYALLEQRFKPRSPYDGFVERTAITSDFETELFGRATALRYRPKISILMPVYNVSPIWFRQAVASVVDQFYDNWELCIADDRSTKPELMAEYAALPDDPRIRLVKRESNGHICAASNSAADLATGEFIALLDHDDCLAREALLEVVTALQDQPAADLLYSDEDKIDVMGRRYDPQFKPDWSPELLLSYNYINHFTVIRRSLFEAVGRFRLGFEGSQDHDLLLRSTERTDQIVHIPRVLYHWRAHAESTAGRATQKTIVHTSGRKAVEDALSRRGIAARLEVPEFAQRLGLPILEYVGDDQGPSVAIVIYGPDSAATVRAVHAKTAYQNYTTYLVLEDENTAESLNRLAAARTEEILVFLKAGTEPENPRWLSKLVANLHGVGAAGGLIRDRLGRIHSAGTVLGLHDGTAPDHACRGVEGVSYYFYAEVTRNVSAVSAGCLATGRTTFERLGGFDSDRFGRTMFDVDYCTRLTLRGDRCVHVGGAEFVTKDVGPRTDDPLELLAYRKAYGRRIDPYSNPHFDESRGFRPSGDVLPALPARTRTPLRMVVAAHNLNNPEGAPRYLSEIVTGLHDRGSILPVVWSPLGGAGESVYRTECVPTTVDETDWSRRFVDGRWTRKEFDGARRYLMRFLQSQRPDLVLANTLLTFPMIEAAASLGIANVWIIHESYSPEVLARLFPPFARQRIEAAFRLATRVVPASHDTARLFERLDVRGNFRVIHNGIPDVKAGPRRVTGKKRVLSIGTVCERKGQHTLIEAARIMAKRRDDFVVDLVGLRDVVPYSGYVRRLVVRHRLESIVNLVSETNDVDTYFRSADIFVCTSHMETFSRSILEAEAYGLPIVSTPCQGLSEQVSWGFNALPYDFGDAEGLAIQLERMLTDDKFRLEAARRSRAKFEVHLAMDEMLDRYDLVIRSAVGRSSWDGTTKLHPIRQAA